MSQSGDYRLSVGDSSAPGQTNWRWCNKCQGTAFAGNPTPGPCVAGGVHDYAGSGDYTLHHNANPPVPGGQDRWCWCSKCQMLAFDGYSACAAGGAHTHTGSGQYVLTVDATAPGQPNWKWCNKCNGLAFAGNPTVGTCARGGQHNHTGSGNYVLQTSGGNGQSNWAWCKNCQLLWSSNGEGSGGVCPNGDVPHVNKGSGNYTTPFEE